MRGNQNAKGHKHTPETRAKMSAGHRGNHSALGYKHTLETRAKVGAALKGNKNAVGNKNAAGHKVPPELRAKVSAANQKRDWTPEMRAKLSGPNGPSWRGGISREPYGWEWNAELREEVRRREGYKCQLCGVPQAECQTKLAVHHINYNKRDNDPLNFVALCNLCHSRTNHRRKQWQEFFEDRPYV